MGRTGRPARLGLTQISSGEGKGRLLLTVEDQAESERLRAAAEAPEAACGNWFRASTRLSGRRRLLINLLL